MTNTNGPGGSTERVGLYMRVSSEEQRDRETIEIQREFLKQYCQLYGLEAAETYADDGVSGTIPLHERPEGRRLLQDAKEGRFGAVLIYKLDRLGRTLLVIVDAHDRLQEAGVALRSATEPIDTSNPSGRLIFQMLASFAEYDKENIAERTRGGLRRAFSRGTHTGSIPYGYTIAVGDGGFEIVEVEAAVVREIIANVAGGATLYSEAQRLNALGVPSPGWRYAGGERRHGASWLPGTLRRIIGQRAYSGIHEVRLDGGEVVERPVPAIVEPELQQHALARLQENKRYSGGKKGRDYLLRGLVWCDECGTTYVGSAAGGTQTRRYHYYSCSRRKTHSDPRAKILRCPHVGAEWIEGLVWSDVRSFLESPGEVLERVREQMGSDAATEELATRREDLARRLAAKQAEKDRYVRAYAQGHISEDELAVYAADLKNQVENLRLLFTAVETDLAQKQQSRLTAKSTEAWLMTLRERVADVEADTEEARRSRRELARLLVKRITVGADEHGHTRVEVIYRFDPPSEAAPSSSHGVSSTSASGPATPTRPTWAAAPSSPTSFTPPPP
jgi:site-specific DNA recombinase